MQTWSHDWIIAHRGLWNTKSEQNSHRGIATAFSEGFAVEIDIRDLRGRLAISHDPILKSSPFFYFNSSFLDYRVAFNLKCDGIVDKFVPLTETMRATHSFVFDGSIPEMYRYHKSGIPHALRLSEYESEIHWPAPFLWVDGFESEWWLNRASILRLMEKYHLIFVSPELHRRDHRQAFDWFSKLRQNGALNMSVCTDFPQELRKMNA